MNRQTGGALALAALVVLAQIGAAALLSPGKTLADIYASFCTWDCIWYKDIAEKGYYLTVPVENWTFGLGNVAFFPGLPAMAGILFGVGLRVDHAVVIAAQLACWGFWSYVLLLLQRWRIPWLLGVITLVVMVSHPGAFFLVMGYSESLFLCGLCGFLFWLGSGSRYGRLLAAAHGWWMTATRIVGLPLTLFPLLRAMWHKGRDPQRFLWRWVALEGLVTLFAAAGALTFLAFCWWQYGHWDVYTQIQYKGWRMKPIYAAMFQSKSYQFPLYIPGFKSDPQPLSRLATSWTMILLGGITLLDGVPQVIARWWIPAQRLVSARIRERMVLYGAAWSMLFVSMAGLANINMQSMIRYTMPVFMVMSLLGCHYLAHLPPLPAATPKRFGGRRLWFLLPLLALVGLFLYTQAMLIMRFTRYQWVA